MPADSPLKSPTLAGFNPPGSRPWPTDSNGVATKNGRIVQKLWLIVVVVAIIGIPILAWYQYR